MKIILLIDSRIYDNTSDAHNMGTEISKFEHLLASATGGKVENWELSYEHDSSDDQEEKTITAEAVFNIDFDALAFFGIKHKKQIIIASANNITCQLAEDYDYQACPLNLPGKIDPKEEAKAIKQLHAVKGQARFFVDLDDTIIHSEHSYAKERIVYNKDIIAFCQQVQNTFPHIDMQVLTARHSPEFDLLLALLERHYEKDELTVNQGDVLASLKKFDIREDKWSVKIFLEDFNLDLLRISSKLSQVEIDETVKEFYEKDHFLFAEKIVQSLAQAYSLRLSLNHRSYTNGQYKGNHIEKHFSDQPVVFLIDDNPKQLKGFNELSSPFLPLGIKVYTMQDFKISLKKALNNIALSIRALKAVAEDTISSNQGCIAMAQALVACRQKSLADTNSTISLKDIKVAGALTSYSDTLMSSRKRKIDSQDKPHETDHQDKRYQDVSDTTLKPGY
jgi:hypothetical protein